jgi:hypothetical protein
VSTLHVDGAQRCGPRSTMVRATLWTQVHDCLEEVIWFGFMLERIYTYITSTRIVSLSRTATVHGMTRRPSINFSRDTLGPRRSSRPRSSPSHVDWSVYYTNSSTTQSKVVSVSWTSTTQSNKVVSVSWSGSRRRRCAGGEVMRRRRGDLVNVGEGTRLSQGVPVRHRPPPRRRRVVQVLRLSRVLDAAPWPKA